MAVIVGVAIVVIAIGLAAVASKVVIVTVVVHVVIVLASESEVIESRLHVFLSPVAVAEVLIVGTNSVATVRFLILAMGAVVWSVNIEVVVAVALLLVVFAVTIRLTTVVVATVGFAAIGVSTEGVATVVVTAEGISTVVVVVAVRVSFSVEIVAVASTKTIGVTAVGEITRVTIAIVGKTVETIVEAAIAEDSGEVDEGVLVEIVGLGRRGMRERDVVATVIVTVVHGVLVKLGHHVGVVLVLRLPNLLEACGEGELFELRPLDEDLVLRALATLANAEEVLDLVGDKRPL